MTAALIALAPSVGVGFLFYLVIKAMIEGDRRERAAHARWDKQQQAAETKLTPEDAKEHSVEQAAEHASE
jgi:hypothetical protein